MSKTAIFFGSGPVAAESLRLLLLHQTIEAVITKPSTEHAMKAVVGKVPVFTVSTKSELESLLQASTFKSEIGILIDFGIIVSKPVIDHFKYGIINSHFSLLPELRGADPITFAILSGQEKSGVSLMLLVQAMDEGPILAAGELIIEPDFTAPKLTEQLIALSDALLQKTIPGYIDQGWVPVTQDDPAVHGNRQVSYSRRLTKDDGILDFTKAAVVLEREIRAFIGWPKSRTMIAGREVVITQSHVEYTVDGTVTSNTIGGPFAYHKKIYIHTKQGYLVVDRLKPAGKQEMSAEAFLAGYKLQ